MNIIQLGRVTHASKIKAFNRKKAKDTAKIESSPISAIRRVKEEARQDTWCSIHNNCFRVTIGSGESDEHIRLKFEKFLELRRLGATVFSEVRWKNGSRSDLVAVFQNGHIEIFEIAVSEKEASLIEKEDKYPFRMTVIRPYLKERP